MPRAPTTVIGLVRHHLGIRRIVAFCLAFVLAVSGQVTQAAGIVNLGDDLLTTTEGGGTKAKNIDLPADFFGPGSDPFLAPEIPLIGIPLDPGSLGSVDTIVRRLQNADVTLLNNPVVIDIEIIALQLRSIQPITVTFNGGQDPEEWDVDVCLRGPNQPIGTMTITRTHANGGTADPLLSVFGKVIFTQVDPPNIVVSIDHDVFEFDINPSPVPWVDESAVGLEVTGVNLERFCADGSEVVSVTTSNFVFGVEQIDDGGSDGCQIVHITEEVSDTADHDWNIPSLEGVASCCNADGTCTLIGDMAGQTGAKACQDGSGDVINKNCDTVGACCFADDSCVQSNECCCELRGGSWRGDGIPCAKDGTCIPIPTVSTWGLVVLGLLVLIAGTVALQRRTANA